MLTLIKEIVDKLTDHRIISAPMSIFLNQCFGGQLNYFPEETKVLDSNDLMGECTIDNVSQSTV